jgi:triacylglycerol lipase
MDLSDGCLPACPVVLVHGFMGYPRLLVWRMFKGVKSLYESLGINTLQPQIHPSADITFRASQLDQAIIEAFGSDTSVHIIAHSMGGLDARYLVSPNGLNRGHRVISITTLGTPHHGSALAGRVPRVMTYGVSLVANLLSGPWGRVSNFIMTESEIKFWRLLAEDNWTALDQLKSTYLCGSFNEHIVDHSAVSYFSYGGDITKRRVNVIATMRAYILRQMGVYKEAHDGVVPLESSKWGKFMGVLEADHGGLIGLQIIPGLSTGYDHLAFFRNLLPHLAMLEAFS